MSENPKFVGLALSFLDRRPRILATRRTAFRCWAAAVEAMIWRGGGGRVKSAVLTLLP